MARLLTLRNIAAVAGALLLGAAGNGLWELIKPGLRWSSSAVLDLATFGLHSLRDDMYREIAMGAYERAGLNLMNLIMSLLAAISMMLGIYALARLRDRSDPQHRPKPKWVRRLAALYILFLGPLLIVVGTRITYEVRASAHMVQMIAIADPYISIQDRLANRADLAAMQSKGDYVTLETRLAKIILDHNRPTPTFTVY